MHRVGKNVHTDEVGHPEDGDSNFFRNVKYLPEYTASYSTGNYADIFELC
jgi:hypothetical protein